MNQQGSRALWAGVAVVLAVAIGSTVALLTRPSDEPTRAVATPTSHAPSPTTTVALTTTTTLAPPPETTATDPQPSTSAAVTTPTQGGANNAAPAPVEPRHRVYTYSVVVDGAVNGSLEDLRATAQRVWNDDRSWHGAGIDFVEVPDGGSFVLVLANPNEVPDYAAGTCDTFYSCESGGFVVINDDRWVNGSPFWPGGLGDYRTMVLNHEVGHFLGRGHQGCGGGGQLAPVMMQQSMGVGECGMNPWPLDWEIDAVR